MKGIFIPDEVLRLQTLNHTEMMILSIYKYYTEEGKLRCCKMPNEEIYKMLGVGERTFQRMKKHLKELGYIHTNGGISVRYIGVEGGDAGVTQVSKLSSRGDIAATGGDKGDTIGVSKLSPKGDAEDTHNKEKRNKENKKEEKKEMTHFDRIVDRLEDCYKTPEKINYIKDTYKDKIVQLNSFNEIDNGVLESWITGIKTILLKQYGVEPLDDKEKKVVDKPQELYEYNEESDQELIDWVMTL